MKHRLKEMFNRHNRFVYVSYVLIIIAVIFVIISFLPGTTNKQNSLAEMVFRNSKTLTEEAMAQEGSSASITVKTFEKEGYYNVNQLVHSYYSTLMANDETKLSRYTDSVEDIDPLKRKINSQYIELYQSMDCYVRPGMISGTYIVAVEYHVKFKNLATIVPYLDYLYVCTDMSGNLYVTNEPLSEEISAYNGLMYESNIIKQLQEKVVNEYDSALKSDEELAEFVKNLQ